LGTLRAGGFIVRGLVVIVLFHLLGRHRHLLLLHLLTHCVSA